jgi:hypothetical protein
MFAVVSHPCLRTGWRTALVLAVALLANQARAANPPATPRSFEQKVVLDPLGNALVEMKWTLPAKEYDQFKTMLAAPFKKLPNGQMTFGKFPPNVPGMLGFLGLGELPVRIEGLDGALHDSDHTITARFRVSGLARTTDERAWRLDLLDNLRWSNPTDFSLPPVAGQVPYRLVNYDPATATAIVEGEQGNCRFRLVAALPVGTQEVNCRRRADGRYTLTYETARPAPTLGATDKRPQIRLEPRTDLVPALHKLYGDPVWTSFHVARTWFHNRGNQTLTELRVRARLQTTQGKTDWSEWQDVSAVVYSGQVVQEPIHLTLDASVCMPLTGETAKVHVQFEYRQPDGRTVVRSRMGRVELLGRNDGRYTHFDLRELVRDKAMTFHHLFRDTALLEAALVNPHDPVIQGLKAKVSHLAGGQPIRTDAAARQYLEALYNILRANITYVTPMGTVHDSTRFAQHHYLGRRILWTRSGTCIDLAMLYGSTAEASGLQVAIVNIPGHAFPAIRLPQSGQWLYIEATFCDGGTMETSQPFAYAVEFGKKEFDQATGSGAIIVSEISRLREFVSPPELPAEQDRDPLPSLRMPPAKPAVKKVQLLGVKYDVVQGGRKGLEMRLRVELEQATEQGLTVYAVLHDATGQPMWPTSPGNRTPVYKMWDPSSLAFATPLVPSGAAYREVVLFVPYEGIPAPADGKKRTFKLVVKVWSVVWREWLPAPMAVEHSFDFHREALSTATEKV